MFRADYYYEERSMTIAIIIIILSWFFYRRHIPVQGVREIDLQSLTKEDVAIVDTRDFQSSSRNSINQAFCMPLSYLKRHYHEIPEKDVIIVAEDRIEKNLSARILKGRGIQVIGYVLMNNESWLN
ncbi:hypothetical protein [Salinibacillus kushneri]|nr:hypothetical protein [Salinibacillus kushneri]